MFIAAARTRWPVYIAEVERLRAGIQRIVEAARNARLDMGREIVSAVERAAEEVLKP